MATPSLRMLPSFPDSPTNEWASYAQIYSAWMPNRQSRYVLLHSDGSSKLRIFEFENGAWRKARIPADYPQCTLPMNRPRNRMPCGMIGSEHGAFLCIFYQGSHITARIVKTSSGCSQTIDLGFCAPTIACCFTSPEEVLIVAARAEGATMCFTLIDCRRARIRMNAHHPLRDFSQFALVHDLRGTGHAEALARTPGGSITSLRIDYQSLSLQQGLLSLPIRLSADSQIAVEEAGDFYVFSSEISKI